MASWQAMVPLYTARTGNRDSHAWRHRSGNISCDHTSRTTASLSKRLLRILRSFAHDSLVRSL